MIAAEKVKWWKKIAMEKNRRPTFYRAPFYGDVLSINTQTIWIQK